MQKLTVYIPTTHRDVVKDALFEAGAGRYHAYDRCCWQVLGTGQFRPLEGSQPFLGRVGATEQVSEWRVEMLCPDALVADVTAALRRVHPYQEPAFHFTSVSV